MGATMSETKKHWEDIYSNKSSLEVSWYQQKPLMSLDLISHVPLTLGSDIIDVGGGASTLVDHLHDSGYLNLSVLDISANALACAQARLSHKARDINWYEENVLSFNPQKLFFLWHDRAVFHFLTDQSDRLEYVEVLKRALRPDGHVIIAAFAKGGPTKCSGLDIVQYDAVTLMAELGDDFELLEEANEEHMTPANTVQKFVFFRFRRK